MAEKFPVHFLPAFCSFHALCFFMPSRANVWFWPFDSPFEFAANLLFLYKTY